MQNPDDLQNFRFCVDYRRINENSVIWKAYPVKDMYSMLHRAAGFSIYSTIDVNNAFHCIALRRPSQQVTAFALPSGLWCFTRLPFGLSISPQIWAKAAETMLRPVNDVCSHYADDVVCHSNTFEDHLSDLSRVLDQLLSSGVKIKLQKCAFFRNKVVWLGHVLSAEGISPDPDGIQAIKQLRPPCNIKELRSVIGSLNYFKNFLDNYAEILTPLSDLLKKNVTFMWTSKHDRALGMLKDALTSDKILIKPDYDKDFFLQCDASDRAVSAILSQEGIEGTLRPIQYWSKKLSGSEVNYPPSEKEAFAVYLGFRKFESFLQLNRMRLMLLF